jgi:hypothetical protein
MSPSEPEQFQEHRLRNPILPRNTHIAQNAHVNASHDREFGSLLADKKHIYSAEIEIVVKGQGCKAIVGRMLAGIEL